MIALVLSVLLFIATGVTVIARRDEVARGMAMFFGASTVPGCAVALGVLLLALAAAAVALFQLGMFGRL